MKIAFHKLMLFLITATLLLAALSCKKKITEPFVPERMFMPGDIVTTNGETQVILAWSPSLFTETTPEEYTVEISADQQFQGTVIHSEVTDSNAVIISDAILPIKTNFYARVKTNATSKSEESFWVYSDSFRITGEQIFLPIHELKLKDKSVVLTWRIAPGVTKIVLTPEGGAPADYVLTDPEKTAREKLITGLTPATTYTAEIFAGTVSKGLINFTTQDELIYAVVLSPGDDLVAAVDAAANNDVIGLEPGVYDIKGGGTEFESLIILKKTISIVSTSDNPGDTKVNFKEITLRGDGAGIRLRGIEFDGEPANTAGDQALYFLNITGEGGDSNPAQLTDIIVENCIVHDMGNCFLRGNRGGSSGGDHKINSIKVNYCEVYNSAAINNNYTLFQINRLEFISLQLSNSTLYRLGRGLIDWDTNMGGMPEILIQQCTINSLGQAGLDNCLADLNNNTASLTFRNCIIGNIPLDGQTVGNNLMRVNNATVLVTHCNTFNFTNGEATPLDLTFPGTVAQQNNTTINLGWDGTTNDFTLPPGHALRTSGSTGGPVGDLKWAQ